VHDLPEPVARLLLPFSVSARDRVLSFTEEMERAAVLYMTESDRRKGEGILLKRPPEELRFIAELCYPIWLVPWNGKTLIFDGLGVSTHTFQYEVLPDVTKFKNDIQGSANKRKPYTAALTDHARYFESVKSIEEKSVAGLITTPDFIREFQIYLSDALEANESLAKNEGCLTPLVNESAVSSSVTEISELRAVLEREVESLREVMKLITASTRDHVNTIREEARQIQAELTEKIGVAKTSAMERVRQIQEKFDARILGVSENYDRRLQELSQERVKLEKAQSRASLQIEQCDNEISASKGRRDTVGERRWKEEKDKWKREISALKEKIEDLSMQIKETESHRNIEISNVRAEFDAQSEAEMREVRELEAERESKTQLSQKETKSLEDSTSTILQQLETMTKRKRMALERLGMIAMHVPRRKLELAYVPFYLACFQAREQRRYVVYSPVVVGSMKKMTKLKTILGGSKIKSLFQQRSKAVTAVLNQLTVAIGRDPVFKREIYDFGVRADILEAAESREGIVRGLEGLRNEDWLSPTELQALSNLLKGLVT